MIVTFDKEYLKELYESGKANDKKHHFQPEIIRRYKRCIDIMINVSNITALYKYNGLILKNYQEIEKNFVPLESTINIELNS